MNVLCNLSVGCGQELECWQMKVWRSLAHLVSGLRLAQEAGLWLSGVRVRPTLLH